MQTGREPTELTCQYGTFPLTHDLFVEIVFGTPVLTGLIFYPGPSM